MEGSLQKERFFVLCCVSLTPLGFSWAIITHAALVDPHVQLELQDASVCVCVCVSNVCISKWVIGRKRRSMLGRRSAPWCIPSHPISIWMRGRGEGRMDGRRCVSRGVMRRSSRRPSFPFVFSSSSPSLPWRKGTEKDVDCRRGVMAQTSAMGLSPSPTTFNAQGCLSNGNAAMATRLV